MRRGVGLESLWLDSSCSDLSHVSRVFFNQKRLHPLTFAKEGLSTFAPAEDAMMPGILRSQRCSQLFGRKRVWYAQ